MRISRNGQETATELIGAFENMVRKAAIVYPLRDSREFADEKDVLHAYEWAILEVAKSIDARRSSERR